MKIGRKLSPREIENLLMLVLGVEDLTLQGYIRSAKSKAVGADGVEHYIMTIAFPDEFFAEAQAASQTDEEVFVDDDDPKGYVN